DRLVELRRAISARVAEFAVGGRLSAVVERARAPQEPADGVAAAAPSELESDRVSLAPVVALAVTPRGDLEHALALRVLRAAPHQRRREHGGGGRGREGCPAATALPAVAPCLTGRDEARQAHVAGDPELVVEPSLAPRALDQPRSATGVHAFVGEGAAPREREAGTRAGLKGAREASEAGRTGVHDIAGADGALGQQRIEVRLLAHRPALSARARASRRWPGQEEHQDHEQD